MGDDVVRQVKDATDLANIVAMTVSLRRVGSRFRGLCPFHDEKTPSFYVNPDRQTYRCFGCQKGGDVFEYIQERDKLTFPEALEFLARAAGISLDRAHGGRSSSNAERLRSFDVLESAALYFRENLRGTSGEAARRYLESRGFDAGAIDSFRLGWAPSEGTELVRSFQRRGVKIEEMVRVGIARKRDSGGAYDHFRGRLMIPIVDAQGRVVGFGGRVLDNSKPKYINSTETDVFRKRSLLYGFDQARVAIHEVGRAVLVEGYTDVILAHQKGVLSVVATLGTALTEEQCRFLKRHTELVVVLYDGDEAGQSAAERALPLLIAAGLQVRVMKLDEGKDPGDFFTENDQNAFEECLRESSLDAIDFQYRRSRTRTEAHDSTPSSQRSDSSTKVRIGQDLVGLMARIKDPVAQELAVQRSSELLGVGQVSLLNALRLKSEGKTHKVSDALGRRSGGSLDSQRNPEGHSVAHRPRSAREKAVRELVAAVLSNPEFVREINSKLGDAFLIESQTHFPFFKELLDVASMVTHLDGDTDPAEELLEILRDEPEVRAWALEVRDTVPLVDLQNVVRGALDCLDRETRREDLRLMRKDRSQGLSDDGLREFVEQKRKLSGPSSSFTEFNR